MICGVRLSHASYHALYRKSYSTQDVRWRVNAALVQTCGSNNRRLKKMEKRLKYIFTMNVARSVESNFVLEWKRQ